MLSVIFMVQPLRIVSNYFYYDLATRNCNCNCFRDDLAARNYNLRSLELNIVDNIGVGVGTTSSTNVHNIGAGTSSSSNNPLDGNDFDDCFRNNEGDKGNEGVFSLHDTPTDCLF
jgi:hypothetical protein